MKSKHHALSTKLRALHFESLEERALLSITVLQQDFKTVSFSFDGAFSGEGSQGATHAIGSGTATGSGATVYSDQFNGTGNVSGTASGTAVVNSPWGTYSQPFSFTEGGQFTDDNGIISGIVDVFGEPTQITGTLDTSQRPFRLDGSMDINVGGWSQLTGRGTATGTINTPEPDILPTSLAWTSDGVEFEYEIAGGPMPTSDRAAPAASVGLYWASGTDINDVISPALTGEAPIYWNQASGVASAADLSSTPIGATHLLAIVDYDNLVVESDESNNVISLARLLNPLYACTQAFIVRQPTVLDNQESGEVADLPENEQWIDEWSSFYVEVFCSTIDTDNIGIASAQTDLTFNPDYFTAMSIEYGPAFDQVQTGTIDNVAGVINAMGAATLQTDAGDSQPVLLARILFQPTEPNSGVPLVADGNYPQPVDNDFGLSEVQVSVIGGVPVVSTLGVEPDTDLWPVIYDIDDDGQVGLGDLAFFASVYRENVAESTNPYAAIADFDYDGIVNLGDLAFFAAAYRQTKTDGLELPHPPSWPWEASPGVAIATSLTSAFMPTLASLNAQPSLPGDANRDGTVNDHDAEILAANWQKQTSATWSQGDFNGDGRVTDDDVAILAQHWMMTFEDMQDDDEEREAVFAGVGAEDDAFRLFDE